MVWRREWTGEYGLPGAPGHDLHISFRMCGNCCEELEPVLTSFVVVRLVLSESPVSLQLYRTAFQSSVALGFKWVIFVEGL